MRERVTKLLSVLFITSSLLVALFPFYIVNAENAYQIPPDVEKTIYDADGINARWKKNNSSQDMRAVYLGDANSGHFYVFSTSYDALLRYWGGSTGNGVYCDNSYLSNGINYYYGELNLLDGGYKWVFITGFYRAFGAVSSTDTLSNAFYYTYGDGAIIPDQPNYGGLIIDGYSTDIAGSGSAAIKNIDHIRWNPDFDSNGNDISNMTVRLKIVPGNYVASRASDLVLQHYDDFIEDQFNSDETVYNASDGEAVISWEYIVDKFDNILNRVYLFNMGLNLDTWEKQGWLYKLRLEDESNNYVGDWQTVYSSTSSGVQNDLNIVNNNSISQEFISTLQEINNINNVENNWTVNNTDISVTNNYTEPQQGEKPWWAYLLESILNTFNITNNYIYEGDSNTQNITNTVNDSDDDMNRKIGEYQQFEDNFIDNMDDNLTDIDTDIDFLSDNKFISSANWVTQQYNRITTNNVIGSFIGFSLLFGLALIFIGKIHR